MVDSSPPVSRALCPPLDIGSPLLPADSVGSEPAEAFLDLLHVHEPGLLDLLHQAQVLGLQLLEFLVELFVPRVQDEDLERERRGRDQEVRDGETPSDNHVVGGGKKIRAREQSRVVS